jgi:hypothetical protein
VWLPRVELERERKMSVLDREMSVLELVEGDFGERGGGGKERRKEEREKRCLVFNSKQVAYTICDSFKYVSFLIIFLTVLLY